MTLTVSDMFCGAGGSAQGIAGVPGVELRIATNHWKLAIESHAENFPDADHMIADISQVDPRRFPRTDILWASPECTNHSQAKGIKRATDLGPDLFGETLPDEAAERSRATMWDVPRFAEHHRYRAVITENVVDAAKWVMFPAWLQAMSLLGYEHQIVYLNSMHAPAAIAPRAPQSRDRMYVVFHRAGDRVPDVEPRPLAWCANCAVEVRAVQWWKKGRWGRYRQQYLYRCPTSRCAAIVEPYALPAAHAIDWAMPGTRIGDRAKPLSPKTIARIEAGLRKYANPQRPFVTQFRERVRDIDPRVQPFATVVSDGAGNGLVVPVEGRDGKQAQPTTEAMRTMTTRAETALVVPYYGSTLCAQPATSPFPTMGTVDTAGVAFIAELYGTATTRPVDVPLSTVVASGNHHMLVRNNTSKGGGGEMCTPAAEPARTITTAGHQSLVSITQQVEDATFRMLEPHEIQAAMAFHSAYRVLGNRRERVRQLGNAVTPPAAEFLVGAVAAALA
jgi:DNA (cytosine-5)-methyltransferase 1